MKTDESILKELQEYDKIYQDVTEEQLQKGFEISLTVKEFDEPEEYLSEPDLFCLSAFYQYQAIIESKRLKELSDDDYKFLPEDLEEE